MSWLTQIEYWHWLGFAMLLGILDISIGASFALIWAGIAAAIVGLIDWVWPMSWQAQFTVFAILLLCCLFAWRFFQKKQPPDVMLNQRGQAHIGRTMVLKTDIVDGEGIIILNDTRWRISGPDCPAGTKVRLMALEEDVFQVVIEDKDNANG